MVAWVAISAGRDWGQLDMTGATKEEMRDAGGAWPGRPRRLPAGFCLAPDSDAVAAAAAGGPGIQPRVMTYSVLSKELLVRVAEHIVMPAVPA